MTDVLRKPVSVAGARAGRALTVIPAGTAADDIDPVDLAQLHPDHFVNVDDTMKRTGDPVAADLAARTYEMAAYLRAVDESPGVDSTEHVDDPTVFAGHPDESAQLAARAEEGQS